MSNSFDLQHIIPGRAINFVTGLGGNALAIPPFSGVPVHIILNTLFIRCSKLQCATAMNINYQRSPKTEQFRTAKISGNALNGGEHAVLRQFSTAKIQGCANVWSNSSRSEGMWLGWWTPRVDRSLKLAELHKN